MKTFRELVTELKASTLGSYIKKASKDANDLAYIQGAAGSLNAPFERKKKHQRERGIETASDKLAKGQVTKEETEELDELSKKTLGSYIKKASGDAKYRAYNAGADDWGNGEDQKHPSRRTWPGRKDDDKAHQRLKGIATATDKLTKEDVETIKHPVGKRPKGIGWVLKSAGEQTGKDHSVWQRKTKSAIIKGQVTKEETELDEARQKQEIKQAPHAIDTDNLKRPLTRKEMSSDESKTFMSKLHPGSKHGLEQHQNPNYKGKTVDHVWRNEKGEMIGFQGKNSKRLWHHDPKAYDATAVASVKKEERDLDSRIAEIIEKRALEIENIRYIDESLTKSDPAEKWIHDFVHSDNPKFAGKSKSERRQMALGAYYGKQKETNESFTDKQINQLKTAYAGIENINPSSDAYNKLIKQLDSASPKDLEKLASANIKFVSSLARNRVNRAKLYNS